MCDNVKQSRKGIGPSSAATHYRLFAWLNQPKILAGITRKPIVLADVAAKASKALKEPVSTYRLKSGLDAANIKYTTRRRRGSHSAAVLGGRKGALAKARKEVIAELEPRIDWLAERYSNLAGAMGAIPEIPPWK